MGGLLDGLPVGNISAGVLLAFVIWLILTGRLVPRRYLDDIRADRDQWRTAADSWQSMATKLGMSVEGLTSSVERLTVSSDAATKALEALQSAVGEHPR